MDWKSDPSSDNLIDHEDTGHGYVFKNHNKIDTVYNATNLKWQSIHDAIGSEKNIELFDTELIVHGNISSDDSTKISIHVNKNCMTELLLLDNTKVLSLFDRLYCKSSFRASDKKQWVFVMVTYNELYWTQDKKYKRRDESKQVYLTKF